MSEKRIYTCITYEDIDTAKDPIWRLAHACLNESEWGLMTIDDILDDIVLEFPERFGDPVYDPETNRITLPSTRATLRSNMSTSPDFARVVRVGRFWAWGLTGTIAGVPREDKKAARKAAKELEEHSKKANAARRRARGAEKRAGDASTSTAHLISPYGGRPATRAHPAQVPATDLEPMNVDFNDIAMDYDYDLWVQNGRPSFGAQDYSHPPTDHPEIPRD